MGHDGGFLRVCGAGRREAMCGVNVLYGRQDIKGLIRGLPGRRGTCDCKDIGRGS